MKEEKKKVRTWVVREEGWERGNIIKIYCMKTFIFNKNSKQKEQTKW